MLQALNSSLPSRAEPRGRKHEAGNGKADLLHNEYINKILCTFNSELFVYSRMHFCHHKSCDVMVACLKVEVTTGDTLL